MNMESTDQLIRVRESLNMIQGFLDDGDIRRADDTLSALIGECPTNWWARYSASILFERIGNMEASVNNAAIALALEPRNPLSYRRIAFCTSRNGEDGTAQRILELGWAEMVKIVPKSQLSPERNRYFDLSESWRFHSES